jgi:hypothetical protein
MPGTEVHSFETLKETWEKLERGDYDWAITMATSPDSDPHS